MYTKKLKKDITILKIFTGSSLSNGKSQSESHHRGHILQNTSQGIECKGLTFTI